MGGAATNDAIMQRTALPGVPDPLLPGDIGNKAYIDAAIAAAVAALQINTYARVVKTSDQIVNNSEVLVNDTELKVALEANKTYGFALLIILSSGATPDFRFNNVIPAGASGFMNNSALGNQPTSTTVNVTGLRTFATDGSTQMMYRTGNIVVVGTADDFQFQFAQQTANASDTKVKQGSYLIVWEQL